MDATADVVAEMAALKSRALDALHGKDDAFEGRAAARRLKELRHEQQAEDHPEYYEATILSKLVSGTPPRRLGKYTRKLFKMRGKRGQNEAFDAFGAEINKLRDSIDGMQDLKVPSHLAHLDPDEVWDLARSIISEIERLIGPAWLNSGTLLGSVRDGGLIGYDDDIDLAVLLEADNPLDAAQKWADAMGALTAAGHSLMVRPVNPAIMKFNNPLLRVDLFPAWLSGDQVFVYPHTFGTLDKADLMPFGTCQVSGLRIPANSEAFLHENYGAGWRTPDPSFSFPWHRQNRAFEAFRGTLIRKEVNWAEQLVDAS